MRWVVGRIGAWVALEVNFVPGSIPQQMNMAPMGGFGAAGGFNGGFQPNMLPQQGMAMGMVQNNHMARKF